MCKSLIKHSITYVRVYWGVQPDSGWNNRANKITSDRTGADDGDEKRSSRSLWLEKGSLIEVDHVA